MSDGSAGGFRGITAFPFALTESLLCCGRFFVLLVFLCRCWCCPVGYRFGYRFGCRAFRFVARLGWTCFFVPRVF